MILCFVMQAEQRKWREHMYARENNRGAGRRRSSGITNGRSSGTNGQSLSPAASAMEGQAMSPGLRLPKFARQMYGEQWR